MMSEKLTRRHFLTTTAMVAGAGVLAACAPTDGAKPTDAPSVPTAAESQVTPEPAPEGATEVRWSHWWGDQHKSWIPIIQEKTNTVIKEEIYPFGEYVTKVKTQVAGGVAPDIIQLDAGHNAEFFPQGIFVPLEDALAKAGIDMSKWNVDPAVEVGYKGKILGLSIFTMQAMMVYLNLDLVENAGYPVDELPLYGNDNYDKWVWDDFVEFLKAVTIKKADGTVEQYGYQAALTEPVNFVYQLASRGGEILDDVWNYEETECLLTAPEAIAAAHDLADLTTVHGVAPTLEASQGIEGGLFRAGMAVADINWTNQSYLVAELPFKLGFMHLPFVDKRVHGVGANHLCVNNKSKVVEAAQDVTIVQTTDYEVGQALVDLAATISAYDPAYYLNSLPEGDLGVITKIMLSRLAGMSDCDYCSADTLMFPRGGYGRAGQLLQDTFRSEMELVMTGSKTVEQALQDAKTEIDAEIKALEA